MGVQTGNVCGATPQTSHELINIVTKRKQTSFFIYLLYTCEISEERCLFYFFSPIKDMAINGYYRKEDDFILILLKLYSRWFLGVFPSLVLRVPSRSEKLLSEHFDCHYLCSIQIPLLLRYLRVQRVNIRCCWPQRTLLPDDNLGSIQSCTLRSAMDLWCISRSRGTPN